MHIISKVGAHGVNENRYKEISQDEGKETARCENEGDARQTQIS